MAENASTSTLFGENSTPRHKGSLTGAKTKGDPGRKKLSGVIVRSVDVTGNLTGNIFSAGNTAVLYGGKYYFTDANGQVTGGILSVGGSISPGVVIS